MRNFNKKYQAYKIEGIMTGDSNDISLAVASAYFHFNEEPDNKQHKETIVHLNQLAYTLFEKNGIDCDSSGLLVIPSQEDGRFSIIEIDVPKEHALYFSVEDISSGLVLVYNHNHQEEE